MAKYEVALWGSHPDAGNDDCYSSADFDTQAEALEAFWSEPSDPSVAYLELNIYTGEKQDGCDVVDQLAVRPNPSYRAESNDDWRMEQAMEAGMLHGCDAYNEVMGWD